MKLRKMGADFLREYYMPHEMKKMKRNNKSGRFAVKQNDRFRS